MKQFWGDDAEVFRPERWLESTKPSSDESVAWMPFLLGARACIGNRFAFTEMQVVLAVILARFHMEPHPTKVVGAKRDITVRPDPGLPMFVSRVA